MMSKKGKPVRFMTLLHSHSSYHSWYHSYHSYVSYHSYKMMSKKEKPVRFMTLLHSAASVFEPLKMTCDRNDECTRTHSHKENLTFFYKQEWHGIAMISAYTFFFNKKKMRYRNDQRTRAHSHEEMIFFFEKNDAVSQRSAHTCSQRFATEMTWHTWHDSDL